MAHLAFGANEGNEMPKKRPRWLHRGMADTGITWIRMDFGWQGIERKAGVYDFSAYDHLLNELDSMHIRVLFMGIRCMGRAHSCRATTWPANG